jgi:hypothetical protein
MEYFEIYCFGSEPFFAQPIQVGKRVWLDGIDGFYDQYFESCAAVGQNDIRFVAISNGVTSIPNDCVEFEALPFIEARIVNNQMLYAEVEITQVLSLGGWARMAPLLAKTRWNDLPIGSEFSQEMFSDLLKETLANKYALRRFSRRDWKYSMISAVYLFKTDFDVRCIVLKDNTVPSFLFQVNKEL